MISCKPYTRHLPYQAHASTMIFLAGSTPRQQVPRASRSLQHRQQLEVYIAQPMPSPFHTRTGGPRSSPYASHGMKASNVCSKLSTYTSRSTNDATSIRTTAVTAAPHRQHRQHQESRRSIRTRRSPSAGELHAAIRLRHYLRMGGVAYRLKSRGQRGWDRSLH